MQILAPTASIRPEEAMLLEQAMLELAADDRELIKHRAGFTSTLRVAETDANVASSISYVSVDRIAATGGPGIFRK